MTPKVWTLHELLKVSAEFLREREIDSPRLSAEILLAHQLGMRRVDLYLNFDRPLNHDEVSEYRTLVKRRLKREPIQYITGRQEFWSLEFKVSPDVLIPRAESELLIETALSLWSDQGIARAHPPRILDLGTGSGVLAISLSREMKDAILIGSDISIKALRMARVNSEGHSVTNRVAFVLGSLFQPFKSGGHTFDMILSNPPYIPRETFSALSPEVRDYEPRIALDGGVEGMAYVKRIIGEAPDYLSPGGWLLLEMDSDQTQKALDLIKKEPRYDPGIRLKDYSRRYRLVLVRRR